VRATKVRKRQSLNGVLQGESDKSDDLPALDQLITLIEGGKHVKDGVQKFGNRNPKRLHGHVCEGWVPA
jgi:hypothetical protein